MTLTRLRACAAGQGFSLGKLTGQVDHNAARAGLATQFAFQPHQCGGSNPTICCTLRDGIPTCCGSVLCESAAQAHEPPPVGADPRVRPEHWPSSACPFQSEAVSSCEPSSLNPVHHQSPQPRPQPQHKRERYKGQAQPVKWLGLRREANL